MTAQGFTDPQTRADLDRLQRPGAADTIEACAAALRNTELSLRAWEIAAVVQQPLGRVLPALHRLQDADRAIMKNGWYRASAAERKRGRRDAALTELARLGQEFDAGE